MGLEVDVRASRCHKLAIQHAMQDLIDPGENGRGIGHPRGLLRKRDLEHGRDQRRGHAMTGNVGDEHGESKFVELEEVIEVAGHLRVRSPQRRASVPAKLHAARPHRRGRR